MKTLCRLLLCFLFLTVSKATAQETFAPLISENTVAFVHVDFRNVEIEAVKDNLQNLGESLIKELGFDERSFRATARELAVELEKLDIIVRPIFQTVTQELGIREYAILADMQLLEREIPAVIAIPWKGKTDKHLQTLCTLFNNEELADDFVPVGDLLLLSVNPNPWRVDSDLLVDWAKKVLPSPNSPIYAALKSVEGAEIKLAVAVPEQLRTMIRSLPLPPEIPAEVRNMLLFAAQRVDWASASLSLSGLLGTEPPENADVLLTVKMTRPTDARMVYGMLENLIEVGVSSARFMMEMQARNFGDDFPVPPLAFQFAKGVLRTLLPDVEEDKLIFRLKGNVVGSQVALSAVGMGTAVLLPAIQASREAARKAQCTNNIKQIVLAIHWYHDTCNGLPPLYTVDAEGKPLHSWRVLLLPFIEQQALYDSIRLNEPWDSEHNKQFHAMIPVVYQCPNNPGGCAYSTIAGAAFRPALPAHGQSPRDTLALWTDGTSNQFVVVEVKEPFNWMDPTADIDLDELAKGINKPNGRVGSSHKGGINVGMGDGSVRFVPDEVDSEILRAFGDPRDGRAVSLPR